MLEFSAFILAVLSLLTTLFIWAEQRRLRRNLIQDKEMREKHARDEIYKILRQIPRVR